jgi:hypothetical protein
MRAIFEMEMPKGCIECLLVVQEYAGATPWCKVTGENCTKACGKRNENCPLKPMGLEKPL